MSARTVLRRVIEDLIPQAERRQVDLGMTRQDDVRIQLTEVELTAIMRNLMDNAIRYSPLRKGCKSLAQVWLPGA